MSKFVTISKWGPSLGIRIPQYIVDNLELMPGDHVEINYEGRRIMIELHKAQRSPQLKTPAEEFEDSIRRQLHEAGIPGYEQIT